MAKKKKDVSWISAIVEVLRKNGGPMHYTDIVDQILNQEFRGKIGVTPSHTVNSLLNRDIKNGKNALFVKVGKGTFELRDNQSIQQIQTKIEAENDEVEEESIEEETFGIIRAFGMYWLRDSVEWNSNPKIYGAEREGLARIDFSSQRGIYFLLDGSRVIYVGRTIDRPLGKRLYEHTKDRHNGRWNRFSWFGSLAVDGESGKLVEKKSGAFTAEQCIIAMEAILIEGLEPPQNRRGGDGIGVNEFIQVKDPDIEIRDLKKKMESLIEASKA